MHPNPVIRHMEDSLIHRRHVAANTLVSGVNCADGGPLLRCTGMATQADLYGCPFHVRARRIAMCVVATGACDGLSALDEALRMAQRVNLIGDQKFVRKGISLIGESRVTWGACLKALLACQHFRIDDARARFALADRLDMLQAGAVAALASHAALFARSQSTGLAMTRETLHRKAGTDHPAKCGFVRPGCFKRKTRRERQSAVRRVIHISG